MINNVILLGRLGADPEVKSFNSGELVKLRVATSESYKDKNDEWQEVTQWHNVSCWGKLTEKAKKLTKGETIAVEGSITYSESDGKWFTDIKAHRVRRVPTGAKTEVVSSEPKEVRGNDEGDDLPF